MPQVTISKDVPANPHTLWGVLSNFADVGWIPVAGQVDVHGEGVGMRRAIHGNGATPVVETLTSIDHTRMQLGYSISDNPLPVSRFEALVTVGGSDTGGSTLTWLVDYDPSGSTEADAAAARDAIEAVYEMMAGWLADAASAKGSP
ncbi:SRPBCC family protein [Mycobacterium sp. EPa45]|uniref:SRPBCC family protein n=1 Tax=Mycobacterium sp. EPa45 TaxID=1545728 RepID=UPI0006423D16|nr:SRPBCC family protein [Mycobacterium sp. EPa45]AKK29484.1 hypothetical protein AB431_25570 [Mycobacterium sp. EPa45]